MRERHQRCLGGESITFEVSAEMDGRQSHLLVSHNPIFSNGEAVGASLMAKDFTPRREMELAVRRQSRVVELLQAIAAAANEATSSDAAITRCLKLVAEFAGWPIGHAFVLAQGELVSRRTWYLRDASAFTAFCRETESLRFTSGVGLPGRVLASKQPAWMASLRDQTFMRARLAEENGLLSGFAFPVLVGDEVATVVEFFSERAEAPPPELVEVMVNVGIQLGRVIERERHGAEVRELSLTDELTGLHNRRGFLALASQQLRSLARQQRPCAVLFLDLDGLKRINDQLGHEAGDEAIAAFARVLRRTFRDGDILSRFGGDEFVIFLDSPLKAADAACARLLRNLRDENAMRAEPAWLAASVGAVEAGAGVSLEEVIAKADALMYQNKRARRSSAAMSQEQ
jgi:diguanylate cyclase (GGDEF)-like protein